MSTSPWHERWHGDEDVATPFPLGAASGCAQLDVDPDPKQDSIGNMPAWHGEE
jgi:hypothetical protein